MPFAVARAIGATYDIETNELVKCGRFRGQLSGRETRGVTFLRRAQQSPGLTTRWSDCGTRAGLTGRRGKRIATRFVSLTRKGREERERAREQRCQRAEERDAPPPPFCHRCHDEECAACRKQSGLPKPDSHRFVADMADALCVVLRPAEVSAGAAKRTVPWRDVNGQCEHDTQDCEQE